jgi:hypothetical protein
MKDVAACKVAATYTPALHVANAPQKAKEGGSTSSDTSEDTSEDSSDEDDEEDDEEEHIRDNKTEPVRSGTAYHATWAAASSTNTSSHKSSTRSETKHCTLPSRPRFTLPKPVLLPDIHRTKTESVEPRDVNLEDPFVNTVQPRLCGAESHPVKVGGAQVTSSKSVEWLGRRGGNNKQLMTKAEFLQMREKFAEVGSSIKAKKSSCQTVDESLKLDEGEDFFNSPSWWRTEHEHKTHATPNTPLQIKRFKISSIPPAQVQPPKRFSGSEHSAKKKALSVRSELPIPPQKFNSKRLGRLESMVSTSQHQLKFNAHILRWEPKVLCYQHNVKTATEIVRPMSISSSSEGRLRHNRPNTGMDCNNPSHSTCTEVVAPSAQLRIFDAAIADSTAINVGAASDVSLPPPKQLDRALDRMLAAQSRIVEGRIEEPLKQRMVGLS